MATKFVPGQDIEYGYPRDATRGGHWYAARVVEAVDGSPTVVQVRNGRGDWMAPIRVALLRTGAVFRAVPAKPWVLRRKRPTNMPSGRQAWSYFVQLTFLVQLGSLREAYRYATEAAARKDLKALGDDYVALPMDLARRDEDALTPEAT